VRENATRLLARLVQEADDAAVERRFSSALVQRALFGAMARAYEPDAAGGFEGALCYELSRPLSAGTTICWTIEILDGRAIARRGPAPEAALTLRFRLADFVRIAAGTLDPAAPLLADRASFEGDFALAARLPEMFGAPSPY
jgi:putative sterol carrier protein